jgi:hypothetical protein
MEPSEFIATAVRLSASNRESDLRSAVSRAYYGAYHVALDYVSRAGVSLPTAADSHEKLVWCLEAGGHDLAAKVAVRLGLLRRDRNVADYDLRDTRFQSALNVRIQLDRVRELMAALDACSVEPVRTQVWASIREYAQSILRLPVSPE